MSIYEQMEDEPLFHCSFYVGQAVNLSARLLGTTKHAGRNAWLRHLRESNQRGFVYVWLCAGDMNAMERLVSGYFQPCYGRKSGRSLAVPPNPSIEPVEVITSRKKSDWSALRLAIADFPARSPSIYMLASAPSGNGKAL
jgi:hypothetical protein